jgi:hypothetical protein
MRPRLRSRLDFLRVLAAVVSASTILTANGLSLSLSLSARQVLVLQVE